MLKQTNANNDVYLGYHIHCMTYLFPHTYFNAIYFQFCFSMVKRAPQQYPRASDAPTTRGPVLTVPQMELIAEAFRKAKKDYPHLKAIGYSKLALPPSIKRTAAGKVLVELNKAGPRRSALRRRPRRRWEIPGSGT